MNYTSFASQNCVEHFKHNCNTAMDLLVKTIAYLTFNSLPCKLAKHLSQN